MYSSNELKILNNQGFNKLFRENVQDFINVAINEFIQDKQLFDMNNFKLSYFDEYALQTNCHKEIFNTLYLEINQPLNFKPQKLSKKKSEKIQFPELYLSLEDFIEAVFNYLYLTLDSNNIVWKDEYSVNLRTTDVIDNELCEFYFKIIPCITYYNKSNKKGVMYRKNNGIEIIYTDIALKNFKKKNKDTKNKFQQTILIFKNLLLTDKKISDLPSEIIETLLYNVPNEMFVDDSKNTMVNIINFLRNNSPKNFKTIDEEDLAFVSIYRSMSIFYVNHIINILGKILTRI